MQRVPTGRGPRGRRADDTTYHPSFSLADAQSRFVRACLGDRAPLLAPPAPLPASAAPPSGAAAVIPAPGIACERAAAAAQAAAAAAVTAQAEAAAAAGLGGPATHFSECPSPFNHFIESHAASIVRRAPDMQRPCHYIGIGI